MASKQIKYVGETALTEIVAQAKKAINAVDTAKVDKVTGKGLSTNDYTTTEKNKLAGIATGAQVNVIETVKVKTQGTASSATTNTLTPSSKAVTVDLSAYPTVAQVKALNDLTNYYTKSNTYNKSEVDTLISDLHAIKFIKLGTNENLPAVGQSNVIYLVPHKHIHEEDSTYLDNQAPANSDDTFDEYVWLEGGVAGTGSYEKIGSTDISLEDYIQSMNSGKRAQGISTDLVFTHNPFYNDESNLTISRSDAVGFVWTKDNSTAETKLTISGFSYTPANNPSGTPARVVSWADIPTITEVTNITDTKVPKTTTVNGHALSGNITITASDVGALTPTDAASTYVPLTRTVNGKALSSNITLGVADISGALSSSDLAPYELADDLTAMTKNEATSLWNSTSAAS